MPDDPILGFGTFYYGIPYLENTPNFRELPGLTYLVALAVGIFTHKAFGSRDFLVTMIAHPAKEGLQYTLCLLTNSWIHADWAHYAGNMFAFLTFSPLVEHELSVSDFFLLMALTAIGGSVAEMAFHPAPLLGFSGVVSGVIAFFCFRFPTAIVGMGFLRFAAPTALLIYIGMDVKSCIELVLGLGNTAGFAHLGGALVGCLFHLLTSRGAVSKKFREMADARLKREQRAL